MKKLTALLISIFCITSVFSQSRNIKGQIIDTLNKQNLFLSSVSLLRAKDSVLVKFTRSDKEGRFSLDNLPEGKHIIMITYPAFADYFEDVDLTARPTQDSRQVRLTLKSKLLEDVLVRTRIAAIRMKGDTIEFKADSFKVSAGASVEEMLRKLPGLQVDKDGNITAQGTKVEKVLVDGEEFFGDDPTMATKNLQADAIDKVQVFDKKSDQAAFTGIDDGQKTKTINLTLKEDKKKGYFGKVELKGGVGNRWSNTAMLNSFKGKRKLTGYGIMSSTGATGLGWQDRETYGGGGNVEFNADEGYFMVGASSDEFSNWSGTFGGEGIPKSWSSGLNYSNKFNRDKQNVNGSYRYNKLLNEGGGNTITQTILPDTTVFFNRENRDFQTRRQRHSGNGTYEWMIDSFTSLKITANGFTGTTSSNNIYTSQANDALNNLINKNFRTTRSEGENKSFNSNFILRKRFKKIGRTISWSFDQQFKDNDTEVTLFSIADLYGKNQVLSRKDTIDQEKINSNLLNGYNSRLAYTEPILKNTFLELSYGIRLTQSESKKLTYNKGINGKYNVIDPSFSNHFDFRVLTNTGGMMLRYNGKKITVSGGGDVGQSNFQQKDLLKDTLRKYNFTNLFPRGNFQYKFNTNSSLRLGYNGSTRQPTIEQLQPVRDNIDNLNITIGNPNLRQEFRHSFNLNYNFYKLLTQRGLYSYSNFTFISKAISMNQRVLTTPDSAGFRITQYVNMDGNYNMSGGAGYNLKLIRWDLNVNFGLNISKNRYSTLVNNRKNIADNNNYGLNFSLYKFKDKKYNMQYNGSVGYNTSVSSIRPDVHTNYYTHNHNVSLNVTLLKKYEFNSTVNANFRQKINAFDGNNNVILWNGYFGRKFLKNNKGMLRFEAFDIFDQNKGFSRFFNANVTRENTYETLRRYFLLAFVWNFSKTPAGTVVPR
jgi:hypothetical protein